MHRAFSIQMGDDRDYQRGLGVVDSVMSFMRENVGGDDRMLLAVSGGADSMGMLAIVVDNLPCAKDKVVVGHVCHGIRSTEDLDAALVATWCEERGLEFAVKKVKALSVAKMTHASLEACARQLRYEALGVIAGEHNCKWILTAHTLDDSAETVWMRMSNGSPWWELAGIPSRRGTILRPLLEVFRNRLNDYVVSTDIPYRFDESNADLSLLRNRIRNDMKTWPVALSESAKYQLHIAGRTVCAIMDLNRSLARVLPLVIKSSSMSRVIGLAIDAIFIYFNKLKFLPVEVAWASLTQNPEGRLPSHIRRQVSEFVRSNGRKATLKLPGDVRVIRQGGTLWLTDEPEVHVEQRVGLGNWDVAELRLTLNLALSGENGPSQLSSVFSERPLVLRNWRPGDRIKQAGRPRKKISDLLGEMRLNPIVRERTLVLADERGPIMIVGGAIDERAIARADERLTIAVTLS